MKEIIIIALMAYLSLFFGFTGLYVLSDGDGIIGKISHAIYKVLAVSAVVGIIAFGIFVIVALVMWNA